MGGTLPNSASVGLMAGDSTKTVVGNRGVVTVVESNNFTPGQIVTISHLTTPLGCNQSQDRHEYDGSFLVTSVTGSSPPFSKFTYETTTDGTFASTCDGSAGGKFSFSVDASGIFTNLNKDVIINAGAMNNSVWDHSSGNGISPVTDFGTNDIVEVLGPNGNSIPYLQRLNSRRLTLVEANGSISPSTFGDNASPTGTATALTPTNTEPALVQQSTGGTAMTPTGINGQLIHRTARTTGGIRAQFYTRIETSSNVRYWNVLTDKDLPTMAAMDNPAGNYVGFLASTMVGGHYMCVVKDNTTQTSTDSGLAFDTNGHEFEVFEQVGGQPKWRFVIDGIERCSFGISSHIPSPNVNLRYVAGGENLTAAPINFDFGWVNIDEEK